MSGEEPQPPVPTSPLAAALGVPAAIVMAGALIALAIYFGGTQAPGAGEVRGVVASPRSEPPVGEVRAVTAADHVRGPDTARLTLIEYSDLECPFCKRFHPTLTRLLQEYPNDVRWVYRHFPLEQLHSKAKPEAVATECAGEQGKFWEMVDAIFAVTPSNDGLDLTTLPGLAQRAGVTDLKQFESCLSAGAYDAHIEDDLKDAQAAGGQGTPYTVLLTAEGKPVPLSGAQPYERVKAVVDESL